MIAPPDPSPDSGKPGTAPGDWMLAGAPPGARPALVQALPPALRRSWSGPDWDAHLAGAMVAVDTPADDVDRAQGLSMLSDVGVVASVLAGDAGVFITFADGFSVEVTGQSLLRVCHTTGHGHDEGYCPDLAG